MSDKNITCSWIRRKFTRRVQDKIEIERKNKVLGLSFVLVWFKLKTVGVLRFIGST